MSDMDDVARLGEQAGGDDDDAPAITLGDLRGGESVTVKLRGTPSVFDSDEYGEGVRAPAIFVSSDYTFEVDGEELTGGEDVTIISWSKRYAAAWAEYADAHGDPDGDEVTIEKSGSGRDVNYHIERV